MQSSATVIWNGNEVGKAINMRMDMWYIEAEWQPLQSDSTLNFEEKGYKLIAAETINDFAKGFIAQIRYEGTNVEDVVVLSLDRSNIFMRLISKELAAYIDLRLLTPWQNVNDAFYYENELKREIAFFHPLKWKKVKAIGNRTDCDDVLFEIKNGRYKYAVVHLTYNLERSRKFPITHFYKDWEDLYKNRLIKDNEEWLQSPLQ